MRPAPFEGDPVLSAADRDRSIGRSGGAARVRESISLLGGGASVREWMSGFHGSADRSAQWWVARS